MLVESARNLMLDGLPIDRMSLHNGDPGVLGLNNEITGGGYARQVCSFAAASAGARVLSADVDFTATALQGVTHMGLWLNAGSVFRGHKAITGDAAFNAAGEYTVTTGTQITLADA